MEPLALQMWTKLFPILLKLGIAHDDCSTCRISWGPPSKINDSRVSFICITSRILPGQTPATLSSNDCQEEPVCEWLTPKETCHGCQVRMMHLSVKGRALHACSTVATVARPGPRATRKHVPHGSINNQSYSYTISYCRWLPAPSPPG